MLWTAGSIAVTAAIIIVNISNLPSYLGSART